MLDLINYLYGESKWILRQVLKKCVPKELVKRPKSGFGISIDAWLRGDLRELVEELLAKSGLKDEVFSNPVPVRKKWD